MNIQYSPLEVAVLRTIDEAGLQNNNSQWLFTGDFVELVSQKVPCTAGELQPAIDALINDELVSDYTVFRDTYLHVTETGKSVLAKLESS